MTGLGGEEGGSAVSTVGIGVLKLGVVDGSACSVGLHEVLTRVERGRDQGSKELGRMEGVARPLAQMAVDRVEYAGIYSWCKLIVGGATGCCAGRQAGRCRERGPR